jgi:hypothetical protein
MNNLTQNLGRIALNKSTDLISSNQGKTRIIGDAAYNEVSSYKRFRTKPVANPTPEKVWYTSLYVSRRISNKMGRIKFIRLLREAKVLNSSNEPDQKYIDLGYFFVKKTDIRTRFGRLLYRNSTVVYYSEEGINFCRTILNDMS